MSTTLRYLRGRVTLKYVQVDGEYRFTACRRLHANLVGPEERPTSAGFVTIDADRSPPRVHVDGRPSRGLGLCPEPWDEAMIRTLVGDALEGDGEGT